MRIIFGLILGFMYIMVFISSYKKNNDVFSPLCFFSFMQFVSYVPGIMFFKKHLGIDLELINTFYVFLSQVIILLITTFVINMYDNRVKSKNSLYHIKHREGINMDFIGIVLFGLGLIASVYFIHISGGVRYILSNTNNDYFSGRSYLYSLQQLMVIGMLFFFSRKVKINFFLVFVTFLIYSGIQIIFTKRAPIMEAFMLLVFASNYRNKRIQIKSLFKPQILILIFTFTLIIITLPVLRNPAGFSTYSSPFAMISESVKNSGRIFEEYSYTSRDAFVYTHYNTDNFYYGRSFLNFFTAPLPSSLFPWKPPVDDGVYLANYVGGYYISPPSNQYPINNSFPFSSQGSMYANFGILGIIYGSILISLLYAYIYRVLKESDYDIFMIFIYQIVIYKFAFSSKNITQSLIMIVLIMIAFKIFSGIRLTKVKSGGIVPE